MWLVLSRLLMCALVHIGLASHQGLSKSSGRVRRGRVCEAAGCRGWQRPQQQAHAGASPTAGSRLPRAHC